MTKPILLAAAALFSTQLFAADSVYSWGDWSQGVKPAAGSIAQVTPPPAEKPQVSFRPNENRALTRERIQATITVAVAQPTVVVPEIVVERAPPVSTSLPTTPPPPPGSF